MPQSKPLNWLIIFLMIFVSMQITFSYFPFFKKNQITKKMIYMKEKKMEW